MAPLDVAQWLGEVSAEEPAGPNLEFDPAFGELERTAQGKPEQQVGDTLIPGEDPDWKEVAAQAQALLERTRDLRVAAHWAVARLHLSGVPGYAEVVALLRELLQTRWETVHPQLDPEDDNDPTLRANALLRLAHPNWVMRPLRDLPLAASPRGGRVSWRDIQVAIGAAEPDPGREKPSEAVLRGVFADTDPAGLDALRAAVRAAVAGVVAIPATFDAQAGHGTGPDFTELLKLLREIDRGIERFAVASAPAAAAAAAEPEAAMPDAAEAVAVPRPAGGASALSLVAVATRAEALHLLDLVCQYYERHEPSSPLPLLIERARRLADKGFLDILRDLAPDGLNQAQNIAGPRE